MVLTLVAIDKKTPGQSFSAGAEDTSDMLSAAWLLWKLVAAAAECAEQIRGSNAQHTSKIIKIPTWSGILLQFTCSTLW